MKTRNLMIIMILILFIHQLASLGVIADRGGIPSEPVDIYEPGQYAVISWYDGIEVMCLSSVLKTSSLSSVKVLEVFPLPSIPEISLGDEAIFKKLGDMVHDLAIYYNLDESDQRADGVIVYNKVLGPHNVTVIRTNDSSSFIENVYEIARQNGFEITYDISSVEDEVEFYIAKNYNVFVIDIVSLESYVSQTLVRPLIYKFRSDKIYYPMVISSINKGFFRIKLFFLTATPLNDLNSIQVDYLHLTTYVQKTVFRYDIERIDSRLTEIFPSWKLVLYLTYVGLKGRYDLICDDLEFTGPPDIESILSLTTFLLLIAYIAIILGNDNYRGFIIFNSKKVFITYSLLILIPSLIVLLGISHLVLPPITSTADSIIYLLPYLLDAILVIIVLLNIILLKINIDAKQVTKFGAHALQGSLFIALGFIFLVPIAPFLRALYPPLYFYITSNVLIILIYLFVICIALLVTTLLARIIILKGHKLRVSKT